MGEQIRVQGQLMTPGSAAVAEESADVPVDYDRLERCTHDPTLYGQALCGVLFGDEGLRKLWGKARERAEALDIPLRVQLSADPGSPKLQGVAWERLLDPDGVPVAARSEMAFARHVRSERVHIYRTRPVRRFRVLIAVADPIDIAGYELPPVKRAEREAEVKEVLGGISYSVLSEQHRVSRKAILAELSRGYDVLYLVCHGRAGAEPALYLEEEGTGQVDLVDSKAFAEALAGLPDPPRLVVFASCESGGSAEEEPSVAVGPALAANGVPAVLAMNGKVRIDLVSQLIPLLFAELIRSGKPDLATSAAREKVAETDEDWWVAILFTSIRPEDIGWAYPPTELAGEFHNWPALVGSIQRQRCVPIVGPLLSDHLVGDRGQLIGEVARNAGFPMQKFFTTDPHRVGRFVTTHSSRDELIALLSNEFHRGAERSTPPGLALTDTETGIAVVVKELARHLRAQHPADPFRVLAELRLPVYLTTDPFDTLAEALRDAGADPVVEFYRWNTRAEFEPPVWDQDGYYTPSVAQPLVLHLFGRWGVPDSLVLSDDDLLEFTLQMSAVGLPLNMLLNIGRSSLLFLGFGIDDSDFRLVFKSLLPEPPAWPPTRRHVAAQIELSGDVMQNHEQAQEFLDHYFDHAAVAVFWGTVDEFARTLKAKMEEAL